MQMYIGLVCFLIESLVAVSLGFSHTTYKKNPHSGWYPFGVLNRMHWCAPEALLLSREQISLNIIKYIWTARESTECRMALLELWSLEDFQHVNSRGTGTPWSHTVSFPLAWPPQEWLQPIRCLYLSPHPSLSLLLTSCPLPLLPYISSVVALLPAVSNLSILLHIYSPSPLADHLSLASSPFTYAFQVLSTHKRVTSRLLQGG